MPLLVITGYPSSGKSTVAKEIAGFIQDKRKRGKVVVVSDCQTNFNRKEIFNDSHKEREQRGNVRSEVEKQLTTDDLVIADSLNYIKGFRYELFCGAKLAKTTYCVLYCDASTEVIQELNSLKPDAEKYPYPAELLDALAMRYEVPQSKNRWDSPLFVLPILSPTSNKISKNIISNEILEEIYSCLFDANKSLKPNKSTQNPTAAPINFLQELDSITQEVVQSLMSEQKNAVIGDWLTLPGTNQKVEFKKPFTMGELARLRRQYISYTKTHPIYEREKICTLFVSFISNHQA